MGKFFIILGAILIIVGLVLQFAPSLFNWFGKLPGDIVIKDEHSVIFMPFTSMIVLSLLLTVKSQKIIKIPFK